MVAGAVSAARRAAKALPTVDLYAEDCVAGMARRLDAGSVDVVVTSPPYNVGIAYGTYDDRRAADEYLDWIERFGREVHRALAPEGSFFLNVGGTPQNPWIPADVANRLRSIFVLQNQIVWVKSLATGDEDDPTGRRPGLSLGHYKPVNSRRYLHSGHEFVFHFTKTGRVPLDRLAIGVPYRDKSNIARWGRSADRRCRGNVWFVPYRTIQSRKGDRPHPATFPVELPVLCLKLHGLERVRTVLDPFLGLGSTGRAARSLGLNFVGFDIDATYVAEARRALTKAGANA